MWVGLLEQDVGEVPYWCPWVSVSVYMNLLHVWIAAPPVWFCVPVNSQLCLQSQNWWELTPFCCTSDSHCLLCCSLTGFHFPCTSRQNRIRHIHCSLPVANFTLPMSSVLLKLQCSLMVIIMLFPVHSTIRVKPGEICSDYSLRPKRLKKKGRHRW